MSFADRLSHKYMNIIRKEVELSAAAQSNTYRVASLHRAAAAGGAGGGAGGGGRETRLSEPALVLNVPILHRQK